MQPYPLKSNITVDEASSVVVDFQDYGTSAWGQEMDVNMVARYSSAGDQVHTIRVSVPEGDISTLVDQFVYVHRAPTTSTSNLAMSVYSFEVSDGSVASTPGTEDTSSFTVTQVHRPDEASIATGRFNYDPTTPTFTKVKTLYPRKFHLPKNFTIITGICLAVACGIAAVIVYIASWYLIVYISHIHSPTFVPNSGPPVPMVVHDLHGASQALNLDGADPPPNLVIGDGSDAPRAATAYFQLAPPINGPRQLTEDGALSASQLSPLLAEPEASALNLDAFAKQSKPALEPASLAAHVEGLGANVAKEILYGDGSDGPTQVTQKNHLNN